MSGEGAPDKFLDELRAALQDIDKRQKTEDARKMRNLEKELERLREKLR